jgi:hypothetical protein
VETGDANGQTSYIEAENERLAAAIRAAAIREQDR